MFQPISFSPSLKDGSVVSAFWLKLIRNDSAALFLLIVLSSCLFLPGLSHIPPLDRDEARYVQATKQMLVSGDYVDIRYQDETRYKKPIGIYWLQAAAAKISGFGHEAPLWVYRLVSLSGALIAIMLCYWTMRAFAPPPPAFIAAMLLACTFILGAESRIAKTDAVLLALIMGAQGALARIWMRWPARHFDINIGIFWLALSGAVLVKGPVGPIIIFATLVTLFIYDRSFDLWRRIKPLTGLVLFTAIVIPWFLAIGLRSQGAFFAESFGIDFLSKVTAGRESHGAPPLSHLASALLSFWPVPALLLMALPALFKMRRDPLIRFCIGWSVPAWIMFELTATKLPHYTLPLLPALCMMSALAIYQWQNETIGRILGWLAMILLAAPLALIVIIAIAGPFYLQDSPSYTGLLLLIFAILFLAYSLAKLRKGQIYNTLPALYLTALSVSVAFFGFILPSAQSLWISPRLVQAISAYGPCGGDNAVAISGYHEPSFVFLQGTATYLAEAEGAADFLIDESSDISPIICRIAAVEAGYSARFLSVLADAGKRVEAGPVISGLNINGGDRVDIGLYRLVENEGHAG